MSLRNRGQGLGYSKVDVDTWGGIGREKKKGEGEFGMQYAALLKAQNKN